MCSAPPFTQPRTFMHIQVDLEVPQWCGFISTTSIERVGTGVLQNVLNVMVRGSAAMLVSGVSGRSHHDITHGSFQYNIWTRHLHAQDLASPQLARYDYVWLCPLIISPSSSSPLCLPILSSCKSLSLDHNCPTSLAQVPSFLSQLQRDYAKWASGDASRSPVGEL